MRALALAGICRGRRVDMGYQLSWREEQVSRVTISGKTAVGLLGGLGHCCVRERFDRSTQETRVAHIQQKQTRRNAQSRWIWAGRVHQRQR